jgi:hypothetical protein
MFVAVVTLAAALSVPRLPGGVTNLGGPAAAQQSIDVDYFYDALDPYGEWVWHPRFGYVWLPGNVRDDWRPYTVGHWVYTDEYGWYWDSYEPFAWAVYHYGRWGYDPDYGWFWVPGDTWAPAWVNWRYSDNYTGWAPVGPGGGGYAYGAPVDYDPPVAESWVFVQPRYMTSRMIYHYALPVADLNIAFIGATNVYRPVYRTGIVFNFGIPRERVVKYTNRPIVVKKIVRVTNVTNKTVIYKNGKRQGGGINVFAPNLAKGAQPRKDPRRFASSPKEIKIRKTQLRTTLKGDAPKGAGQSAAKVVPISREVGPEGFKPRRNADLGARKNDNDKNDNPKNDNKQNEARGNAQGGGGGGNQGKGGNANDNDRAADRGKQGGQGQGGGGGQGQGGGGGQGQGNKAANKNDKDRNQANANDKGNGPGKTDLTPGGGTGGQNSTNEGGAGMPGSKPKAPIGAPPTGAANADQGQGGGGGGQGKKDQGQGGGQANNQGGDNGPGGPGKRKGQGQGGGQANIQGGDNGPGGPGKRKGQGQGGGQGGQQAQGGGGGGGDKAERCKKHPDAPACQRQ